MRETNPRRPGPPRHPEVRKVVRRQRKVSQNPTPEEQIAGFRGWNERGYVPHRDEPGLTQFVTFRLADSFPAELREEWEKLLRIEDDRERRTQLEAWLDLGHGACHLKNERIAQLVTEALRKFDGTRYRLIAFTIMPNHVHVLFEVGEVPMAKVVRDWKGASARAANALLGLEGPFWQPDYWDTYMRDVEHEQRTIRYIRNNPMKAGFVADGTQWPWTFVRNDDSRSADFSPQHSADTAVAAFALVLHPTEDHPACDIACSIRSRHSWTTCSGLKSALRSERARREVGGEAERRLPVICQFVAP